MCWQMESFIYCSCEMFVCIEVFISYNGPYPFFLSSASILCGHAYNLNVWLQAFEAFKDTLRCHLIINTLTSSFL